MLLYIAACLSRLCTCVCNCGVNLRIYYWRKKVFFRRHGLKAFIV